MTGLALSALLAGLLASPARADDALRATVLEHLSAYETPATAEDLRALGEGVGPELFAIAQDPAVSRTRRVGAVYALGWFPTEERRAWLTAQLGDGSVDSQIRRSAGWALANGWQEAALPTLTAALADPDAQLRNQVVRAVARIGTPAARDALTARLGVETSSMVRTTIQDSLAAK